MICLVTGSSRGLGKEIIKKFASEGFEVIINYNKSEKDAYKLADEIGSKARVIKCDISNEEEVRDMFDQIDHLDVLINNAAIADDKDPLEKTALEFNRVLHTNLTGTFLVTKYAIEKMGNGSIVNISSTNGIDTYYPESIDYDASKAGIISLTHNFAKYLSDIRVNCICPDWIDTDMNLGMDEEYKKSLGVFLNPEEVAKVVYDVSIDESVNDEVIRVGDNSVK